MVDQVQVILRSIRNYTDPQKILNKATTIQEVNTKSVRGGSKYSLKEHEGRTLNLFTTKQDGQDTSAFAQFKNMGLKVGDTGNDWLRRRRIRGRRKKPISKKIINFRELTMDLPKLHLGKNRRGVRQIEAHRVILAMRSADDSESRVISMPYSVTPATSRRWTLASIPSLVREAIAIEDGAEKQLNSSRQVLSRHAPSVVEDLPIAQQDEGDSSLSEDIPF